MTRDDPNQLGEYLRARRGLVTPEQVGLQVGPKRRVSGLRREEVAMLAGVSADYIVRLERGRDTNPSAQVLAALARAVHLAQVGAQAIVYNAGPTGRRELQACQSCLRAVVADAASDQRHLLIIEQDDSLITSDRRVLYAAARNARCENSLRYEHRRAEEELLLALPDAIAWCWARGGRWRDLVRGIVIEEKRL